MWWCCGKRDQDAKGCKIGPHISKEDDADEDEEGLLGVEILKKTKYIKCLCCKQNGHTINDCPLDPNIKTMADIKLDLKRIKKIKDTRKLFAETMITTTHFFKNCVKVPKDDLDTPVIQFDESQLSSCEEY